MKTPKQLAELKTRGDFRRLNEQSQQEQQRLTASELPTDHPIWDMWLIMMSKYGAQWTHGDEPAIGWIHSLRNMSKDQLIKGMDNLIHRDDNHWPPNAEEFADLCRTSFTWETQAHKVFTPENKLEDLTAKEANKVLGANTMAAIKDMFK